MKLKFLLTNIRFFKWTIPLPTLLWFAIAAIAAALELTHGVTVNHTHINNYLIFKQVFWHTVNQQNLYLNYPLEYEDVNLYGPSFSVLMAPFAVLPIYVGCFLWCMANAAFLFYAIMYLPVNEKAKKIILLIGLLELITAIQNIQFNPIVTSWIVLSFALVQKKKDFWAALFITAGFFIKIYGIVGIAFFWFSDNKLKFTLSMLFWSVVMFCLPMLIAPPSFIIQSYEDWYYSLVHKNVKNISVESSNAMQDISVLGMVRRIFHINNLKNYFITLPAAILFALPFLRIKQLRALDFRLSYLAFVLIGVVIFSSSAESATYVIAMIGVAIWFVLQPKNKWVIGLLIFTLFITCLSPTDLFPDYLEVNFVRPYSLKALPCFIVWCMLSYNLLTKNFYATNTQVA